MMIGFCPKLYPHGGKIHGAAFITCAAMDRLF